MTTMMTLADTTRFDANAMSDAIHALGREDAATVADAFIDRVLYILPPALRQQATAALAAGTIDHLAELRSAAEERGSERLWLPDDRDEQARYHLARAEMFVQKALFARLNESRLDDPLGDYGGMVTTVATYAAHAAGHALAADACLLTAAPYTEMGEHYYIESLGTGREMAWQCWRVLDNER